RSEGSALPACFPLPSRCVLSRSRGTVPRSPSRSRLAQGAPKRVRAGGVSLPAVAEEVVRRTVSANGVEFAVLEAGTGPLALCLHGFPDSAHTWRHLLPALAERGFHAVAPFMRGYAPTAIPADGRHRLRALAAGAGAPPG